MPRWPRPPRRHWTTYLIKPHTGQALHERVLQSFKRKATLADALDQHRARIGNNGDLSRRATALQERCRSDGTQVKLQHTCSAQTTIERASLSC